jgi:hypothetical protein
MQRCPTSTLDRAVRLPILNLVVAVAALAAPAASATPCGTGDYPFPFTDVAGVGDPFCPGIMEAYVTGVTKGTTPTTFSPGANVDRMQMTTFLQRSLDQGLRRGSNRAALNQWWTSRDVSAMQLIPSAGNPELCAADREYVWVANTIIGNTVTQVESRTGRVVGTWTGNPAVGDVLVAAGKVFVTGASNPGNLYVIDPTQPPGTMVLAASGLGNRPVRSAFDGRRIWTANNAAGGGVSIVTLEQTMPYPVTNVTAGLGNINGIVYDGSNIWVADATAAALHKLDETGAIVTTVSVGPAAARGPMFDGTNIWVFQGNGAASKITVVQASTGAIVATIPTDAANGLNQPIAGSFDGERVIVANYAGNSVSLFKAADLSPIAHVAMGAGSGPTGACSDGVDFFLTLSDIDRVARY